MPGHIQTYAGNVAAAQLLHCSIAQADFYVPDSASPHASFPAPFVIGVAGGTASGKTSVCQSIIKSLQQDQLEHQGILSLPQDCFYRNLTDDEQKDIANFNFDHPSAYAFDEIIACVKELKRGKVSWRGLDPSLVIHQDIRNPGPSAAVIEAVGLC
jgi:uridine kinase